MYKIECNVTNSEVIFTVNIYGSKVYLLKAIFSNRNDLPRLYKLAQDALNDLTYAMSQAKAA